MSKSKSRDMFRILIASDIHIGYEEKDKVIGEDSFRTFEEVLQIAKDKNVDFVLLGGDLFHYNKPSQKCLLKSAELLRKYSLGDGKVNFKLISDQAENFRHTDLFPHVNYEDANFTVSMPVFTIHGNHDDPTGKNPRTYLEVLSASGLINYFGKYMDMEGINLSPLLLTKGQTKLAIYGLGSLPEERLHRFFREGKMNFLRPSEDTKAWFNLFVVHQNRVAHGTKYLPENFLTTLPNLVIWGHEHEAHTEPQFNTEQGFHVYQPGSTVRTSLSLGELKEKHVGLLEIYRDGTLSENKFQITPIPLKTCRQFYFETVNIDEVLGDDRHKDKRVMDWCTRKVNEIIDLAEREHSGDVIQPRLPLVRLRIESSSTLPFSVYQFGLRFVNKVANPESIILFKMKRIKKNTSSDEPRSTRQIAEGEDGSVITNIEDIVKEYFHDVEDKHQLSILDEGSVTLAVKSLVEKDDTDAIPEELDNLLTKCRKKLMGDKNLQVDDLSEIVALIRSSKLEANGTKQDNGKAKGDGKTSPSQDKDSDLSLDDIDALASPKAKKAKMGKKGTAKKVRKSIDDESDDFMAIDDSPAKPKKKAPARKAATRKRNPDPDVIPDSDDDEIEIISPVKSKGRKKKKVSESEDLSEESDVETTSKASKGAKARSNRGIFRGKSK